MKPLKTVKSETVYEGKIIDVVNDVIELQDGRHAIREVVKHIGAAAIIPVDKDGNIIFVKQYRHPALDYVLEIPAGTLEVGEDPFICAKRELEEETGYKSEDISFVFKFYSAIGFCTEVLHIYLAENLREGKMNLDEDEFIELERYSLDEAVNMIFSGGIIDSKTIAAVLAYKEIISKR